MGFYIRKSFRMGPVRFNLSKSGMGISAGVRGARFGVSSSGRTYVHAGRGGLYFRRYLGSAARLPSTGASLPVASDHRVAYEDTGVTYNTPASPTVEPSLHTKLVRQKSAVAIYLLMPLAGLLVLAVAGSITDISRIPGILGALIGVALLLGWPVPMWRAWWKNRAGTKLGRLLQEKLSEHKPLSDDQLAAITSAMLNPRVTPEDRQYQCQNAYIALVLAIVEDREVAADELQILAQVESRLFGLNQEFYREARLVAFREAYLAAVADHELTEEEEKVLDHIRIALDLPHDALSAELDVIARLREIREIRAGKLPTVEPSNPLQKSEVWNYEAPARLLKERNLRSFQREGQKYKVRGLVIDEEGTLFITNKRVLLLHSGTSSVRLDRILDLEIDYDQNLLTITTDGARAPTLITTPDAVKAGAVIAAAAGL